MEIAESYKMGRKINQENVESPGRASPPAGAVGEALLWERAARQGAALPQAATPVPSGAPLYRVLEKPFKSFWINLTL